MARACVSWRGVGYPRDVVGDVVPAETDGFVDGAWAMLMDAGLGRMVGSRGEGFPEAVADMILGSWMPPGLVAP